MEFRERLNLARNSSLRAAGYRTGNEANIGGNNVTPLKAEAGESLSDSWMDAFRRDAAAYAGSSSGRPDRPN
jgi:hypothetical protein